VGLHDAYRLAAAFTTLVKSFVSDILMPPLSVIFPINKNIEEKFAILRPGETYDPDVGYNTLQQAQDDGAVVMAYG
jgi:large conductance mechanosensitive channel